MNKHLEAKAFADAVLAKLNPIFCLVVDLGVYKSTQNFCMLGCCWQKQGENATGP